MIESRLLTNLRSVVGEEFLRTSPESVEAYGRDETEDLFFPPEVVALPSSVGEVQAILRLAHQNTLCVTVRGAGTGLSGGALPVRGGLVLSLERLNRIRHLDANDMVAEAEAGVITGDLHRAAEAEGLLYPPDPSSLDSCTLGGNLAENAAGPRSLAYGPTRQWVLGLEVVLADGTLIQTGGRNRKDVAGYDLTSLFVGSEGTLGVITAGTFKLAPAPRAFLSLLLPFEDLDAAAEAVQIVCRLSPTVSACEILEQAALGYVSQVLSVPPKLLSMEALLFLELLGESSEILLEVASTIQEAVSKLGGGEIDVAMDADDHRRLWAIRRKVGEAVKHSSVYKEVDTVVPRSALAQAVRAARSVAQQHRLTAVCYGHAGDGNLHVNLLKGELNSEEWEQRRQEAERELHQAILELGGSITGEHGIGWTQREFLPWRYSPIQLNLMKAIKEHFDPRAILNPGKIFLDQ